jgi:hypothetical protein
MIDQVTGAGALLVIVLGYLLIVEAMGAATVLLAEFIVLRLRALRQLLSASAIAQRTTETYRIGGDIRRWE